MLDSNYDINANTKGYYKLNGDSADSSGNGNNGTDTAITYVDGLFGQAGSFNGSSAYITIPYNSMFDVTTVLTMSIWFKKAANGVNMGLISKGGPYVASDSGYAMYLFGSDNKLYFDCKISGTDRQIAGPTAFTDTNRHNIVCTYDGTNMKIYVDGLLVSTGNYSGSISTNSLGIFIGQLNNGTGSTNTPTTAYYFNGSLDEAIIENSSWTATQVLNYYNKAKTRYFGEYLGAGPAITKVLLPLNGDGKDYSGNGNNFTPTAITWGDGKIKGGAEITGSTGNLVAAATNLCASNALTMSIWIYNKQATFGNVHNCIMGGWFGTLNDAMLEIPDSSLGATANLIFFGHFNSGSTICGRQTSIAASTLLPQNQWTLLTATRASSGLPSSIKIYINGEPIALGGVIGSDSAPSLTRTETINIGSNVTYPSSTYHLAVYDEAIIEWREWTAVDIKKYYTYAKGRFGII